LFARYKAGNGRNGSFRSVSADTSPGYNNKEETPTKKGRRKLLCHIAGKSHPKASREEHDGTLWGCRVVSSLGRDQEGHGVKI
jgi:hypothetical protein